MIFFRKLLFISLFICWTSESQAELTIEITRGVETAIPIAVVPFARKNSKARKTQLAQVVQADLSRSGYFKTLATNNMLTQPANVEQVHFRNWRALGQNYLLIGQVSQNAGRYAIQFQLFDVYKGEQLMGYRMTVAPDELRRSAHHISYLVFEKVTGKSGV